MENLTRNGSIYGKVTINLWEKGSIRRAYVNSVMLNKGAGYVDLTTGQAVTTNGNCRMMELVLGNIQMTPAEIVAHFNR